MNDSGTSSTSSSRGSMRLPSSSFVMTSGLEIESSKPSRRIISMRTASCSSPRPNTLNASGESVGVDADGDVGEQLLVQPVADVPGGDPLAVAPRERRGVDREDHRQRRLVDPQGRQRRGSIGRRDGLSDREPLEARQGDDLAGGSFGGFDAFEAVEGEELRDLGVRQPAVTLRHRHRVAHTNRPGEDAADAEPAKIVAVVEVRDQELENAAGIAGRSRNVGHEGLEQRREDPARCRRPWAAQSPPWRFA